MKTESIIVAIPHQGRPIVSHVLDNDDEIVDSLLQHWVDDDYDQNNRDLDDALDRAGRDYNRLEVMTKDEIIERIKSHNIQGHLGIELLTELKKVANNEGWRTHRSHYSDVEIASNRELWGEYVDPDGLTSDDDWDDSTVEERMDEMQKMFTQEETAE
tara:strand:- start:5882 stop:6355 length:474 start_codon:yes stop_codon:yes gene_type:complete